MTAIAARLVRLALLAGILVLGASLVRGITGMLTGAVHGMGPATPAAPSR